MEFEITSQNKPQAVELEAGKLYKWCTCDYSMIQPLCDATHKLLPIDNKSLHFTPEKSGKAFLCQCKKTKNAPYCDGSHAKL